MAGGDEILNVLVVSADGVVTAKAGYYWGAVIDGAGAVNIYDNASAASGKKILQATGAASAVNCLLDRPVKCTNGIFVDLTGNVVTVYFEEG
jgi:hypothetical protein